MFIYNYRMTVVHGEWCCNGYSTIGILLACTQTPWIKRTFDSRTSYIPDLLRR